MNFTRKFKRAFAGLLEVFWPELSIKIEIVIGFLVIIFAYYLNVARVDFLALIGMVFLVIILEGMNTVLERIIDLAEPRYHDAIRQIKDALAALVLLSVFLAVIVGVTIFWPYIKIIFN